MTSDFDRMGCRLEGPFIALKGFRHYFQNVNWIWIHRFRFYGSARYYSFVSRTKAGGYCRIANSISVISKVVQKSSQNTRCSFS